MGFTKLDHQPPPSILHGMADFTSAASASSKTSVSRLKLANWPYLKPKARQRDLPISDQEVLHDKAADCSDRRNAPGGNGCCQHGQAKTLFHSRCRGSATHHHDFR